MVGAEGKGKRAQFRTRTVIEFDHTSKILRNQKEVDEYLTKYGVPLSSNVKVEWCPAETDYIVAPVSGVYLHAQILALRLKFALTSFVRDLLRYFKVALHNW